MIIRIRDEEDATGTLICTSVTHEPAQNPKQIPNPQNLKSQTAANTHHRTPNTRV
jgi:hypothetical protein